MPVANITVLNPKQWILALCGVIVAYIDTYQCAAYKAGLQQIGRQRMNRSRIVSIVAFVSIVTGIFSVASIEPRAQTTTTVLDGGMLIDGVSHVLIPPYA